MKKVIKDSLLKANKYRYHQKHKRIALVALKNIEEDTGYRLSSSQKKIINDYSKEVLGSSVYKYWLYVYTAFNKKFVEGWIPDNYFGDIVAPKINKGIGKIANVKTLSKRIVNSNLFPDKYYLIDNLLYDSEFNLVEFDDLYNEINNGQELFIKRDNSNQGKGVLKLNRKNFNKEILLTFGDSVIQKSIIQNAWFDRITPASVATVRITTVKEFDGKVKMRAVYLRVGTGDSHVVKSASAIRVPIINREGKLGDYGADPNWKRHTKHPDTGFKFSGEKIPYFSKAVEECEKLHSKLPHFSIIGWDVSITNEGEIKIMEWNANHPGIKFSEASMGPCFSGLNWEKLWKL